MAEIVSLRRGPNGGLDVPVDAFRLAHELHNRGLRLTVDGDRLKVAGSDGGNPGLSDTDRVQIQRWKYHLMALVTYEPPDQA